MDFSQSVHHLWKQYRRHGKAGGAEELAAANEQGDKERGVPRGALPGGLQLKPGAGGLYAGPTGDTSSILSNCASYTSEVSTLESHTVRMGVQDHWLLVRVCSVAWHGSVPSQNRYIAWSVLNN